MVAAMYFDDLSIIGHQDDIPKAGQEALNLFDKWKIPRQHEKWLEENKYGIRGAPELTIMGLRYSFVDMTVGIPSARLRDILAEIQSFIELATNKAQNFKKWESIVGVMSWCSIAIPQLRPLLTGTWYFKRVWTNQHDMRGVRRMGKELKTDWEDFMKYMSHWSGTSSIYHEHISKVNKQGYDDHRIDPAADAAGTSGWGVVSEYGYAKGRWTDKEQNLEIHIKEGLALFMLISLFGKKLKGTELSVLLRSDNQGLVKSLKRGRARDRKLNIIVQLITRELLANDMVLRCWKTKQKTATDIEYIGTKENVLADALSRFDMKTFNKITNRLPFNAQQEVEIPRETMKRWTEAVNKIIAII